MENRVRQYGRRRSGSALIVGKLSFLIALAIFLGSFSSLTVFGFSMGDESAGLVARLHPAFYLTALVLAVLFAHSFSCSGSLPSVGVESYTDKHLDKVLGTYIGVVVLALIASGTGVTNGSLANTATTFLLPGLILVAFRYLNEKQRMSIATFVVIFMLLNSIIGVLEKYGDFRIFAYTIGTVEKVLDPRPTAWFSHPLNNATLTGLLLIYFLYSNEARRFGRLFRYLNIGLHGVALASFGGRTAVVGIGVIIVIDYLRSFGRLTTHGKGVITFVIKTVSLLAGAVLLLYMLRIGLFDDLMERFIDDGGSADVRWSSIDIFMDLGIGAALNGLDAGAMEVLLSNYTIPTIELSWQYLILKHGFVIAGLLICAYYYYLLALAKKVGSPAGYMVFFFCIVTFGFTSIASASLLTSQLMIIVVSLLFRTPHLRSVGDSQFRCA
jgi:hypothetical protein